MMVYVYIKIAGVNGCSSPQISEHARFQAIRISPQLQNLPMSTLCAYDL
jgi:hypothetical protein